LVPALRGNERLQAGLTDLLVLGRTYSRNAHSADAHTPNENRKAAPEEESGRNTQRGDAIREPALECCGRDARQRGRSRLHLSDLSGLQSGAVHAVHMPKETARINNRDTYGQLFRRRVRDALGNHVLGI
jgi:hypothetical protein